MFMYAIGIVFGGLAFLAIIGVFLTGARSQDKYQSISGDDYSFTVSAGKVLAFVSTAVFLLLGSLMLSTYLVANTEMIPAYSRQNTLENVHSVLKSFNVTHENHLRCGVMGVSEVSNNSKQLLTDDEGRLSCALVGVSSESTSHNLLTDSDGHLQVDIVSGGNITLSTGDVNVDLSHESDSVVVHGSEGDSVKTNYGGRTVVFDPYLQNAVDNIHTTGSESDFVSVRMHGRMKTSTTSYSLMYPGPLTTPTFWLQSAVTMYVVSNSVEDDPDKNDADDDGSVNPGSGAHKVVIEGLDDNWQYQTTEVTLDGTTPVSVSAVDFIRVFRMYVSDGGTYHSANAGNITLRNIGNSEHYLSIYHDGTSGEGDASVSLWTVPASRTAYVTAVTVMGGGATDDCTTKCFSMTAANTTGNSAFSVFYQQHAAGVFTFNPKTYIGPFAAKTDLWCEAKCTVTKAAMSVSLDIVHT